MAMALGLGFSSPPAVPLGRGSSLDPSAARRTRRLLVVRAINDEDSPITSMRELADGSILISFGAPPTAAAPPAPSSTAAAAASAGSASAHALPKRPPSRSVDVGNKVPIRVPSTFAKKSPISIASRRKPKHTEVESVVAVLGFKDINIDDERAQEQALGAKDREADGELNDALASSSRPRTSFSRKSPIPDESRKITVGGKKKKKKIQAIAIEKHIKHDLDLDKVLPEDRDDAAATLWISRPITAFVRKSPITAGGTVRRKAHSGSKSEESSSSTPAAVPDQNSSSGAGSSDGRVSRPTSAFSRKTPITLNKTRRRRRLTKSSSPSAGKDDSDSDSDSVKNPSEEPKLLQSRPSASFIRKSPIGGGRRKRRSVKKPEPDRKSEVTNLRVRSEEAAVVTEMIVETPIDATAIQFDVTTIELEKESVEATEVVDREAASAAKKKTEKSTKVSVVESTEVVDREAASAAKKKTERSIEASKESVVESTDVEATSMKSIAAEIGTVPDAILRSLEMPETDIEVSDDESTAGDETDLSILTIQRLRSIAKSRGLRGYSRLRKAELIDLLRKS